MEGYWMKVLQITVGFTTGVVYSIFAYKMADITSDWIDQRWNGWGYLAAIFWFSLPIILLLPLIF